MNMVYKESGEPQVLPARLDSSEAAKLLGFQEHDIPVLVKAEFLRPLGKPAQNARKYFAAVEVLKLAADTSWLNRASRLVYQHWEVKNANREKAAAEAQQT